MKRSRSLFTRRLFLKNTCAAGAVLATANFCSGLLPLAAFASSAVIEQRTELLMGTFVTLTSSTADATRAQDAMDLAFAEIRRLLTVFDRHTEHSALGILNAQGRLEDAPQALCTVIAEALRLGRATGFAFNPAVAPLVELFEAARACGQELPTAKDSAVIEALELARPGGIRISGSSLRLERGGMRLTLDGIAKGYIADQASRVLAEAGVADHMVNAGGDIRVRGHACPGNPWTIGVRHPAKPGEMLAVVSLGSGALATSGSYENRYGSGSAHHHLFSHHTGGSPDVLSVSVRADTATQADALATAVAVMPPADAVRYVDAQTSAACLILTEQGAVRASRRWGWPGYL